MSEQSNGLIIFQTVENRHFRSLAEVSVYLKSLSPEERFQIVHEQASKLVAAGEKVDEYKEYLEDFMEEDDTFKDRMAQDPEVWAEISTGANRARTSKKKKEESLSKCFEIWGENNVRYHFAHLLNAGGTTWSKIRRLAMKEADVAVAVRRVRDAVYWRLTHGRPGRSSELYPVAADFEKTKDGELPAVNRAAISAAGYSIDGRGWIAPAEKRLLVRVVGEEDEDSPLSSLPEDDEDDVSEHFFDEPNRRLDLRLGQGRFAEYASPGAGNSRTSRDVEAKTPTD